VTLTDEVDVLSYARTLATLPDGTVLSHRSAAVLWGLWVPAFRGIEVSTPATWRGSRYTTSVQRNSIDAHRRILKEHEVERRHGLLVTSLCRTWLDLAAQLDDYDLTAAGDSALRAGCEHADLLEAAVSMRRQRGTRRAKRIAAILNARSRSRPESRMRAAIVLAGLPEPRINEVVHDRDGGWLAEPDLHYDKAKVALEYNGSDHATLERMRKDSSRTLSLQREGWAVRIYTANQVFSYLDDIVADAAQLLRRRAPHTLTAAAFQR
jgi:hypothetical protein